MTTPTRTLKDYIRHDAECDWHMCAVCSGGSTFTGCRFEKGRHPRLACTCGLDALLERLTKALDEARKPEKLASECFCGHLDSEHAQYHYSCFVRDCECEKFTSSAARLSAERNAEQGGGK